MPAFSAAGGVVGRAVVELIGDTSKLRKDFDAAKSQVGGDTDDMTKRSQRFSAAAAAAFAIAGAAIIKFAVDSVKSFQESEQASIKLQNTLQNNAKLGDVAAESWEAQAAALQDLTGTSDEAITTAQALLGTFDLTGQQVQDLIPLIVDLSQKYGIDMTAATKAVGRAVSGSSGTLSRYGIIIDAAKMKTDAYGATVEALAGKVGGFAQQQATTLQGKLAILANNWDDLKEAVGGFVVGAIDPVVTGINQIIDVFNAVPGPIKTVMFALAGITLGAAALGGTINMVKSGLAGMGIDLGKMIQNSNAAKTAVTGLKVAMGALVIIAGAQMLANAINSLMGFKTAAEQAQENTEQLAFALDDGTVSVDQMREAVDRQNAALDEILKSDAPEFLKQFARDSKLSTDAIEGMAGASSNAAGAVEDEAQAMEEAREAAIKLRNAQLSLAGGFLGVQGAALSARDSSRDLTEAQNEVTRLLDKGKEGSQKYRDAIVALKDAQLDAVQSQLTLTQAVQRYVQEQANGETSQREAVALVKEFGRMAGLTKQDTHELIDSVQGLINKYKDVPDKVTTKVEGNTKPAMTALGALVSYVRNIPGIARTAEIGVQLVNGLITGIGLRDTAFYQSVASLARNAVSMAKGALGIHSPSKVFQEIGEQMVEGMERGIVLQQAQVEHAMKALTDILAMTGEEGLDDAERKIVQRLVRMGKSMSAEIERIKGNMQEMSSDIRSGFDEFGDLMNLDFGEEGMTADSLKQAMKDQADAASEFGVLLERAQKMGLNKDLLSELATAGPEALPLLREITQGGAELVKSLNRDMKSITTSMQVALSNIPTDEFGKKLFAATNDLEAFSKALRRLIVEVTSDDEGKKNVSVSVQPHGGGHGGGGQGDGGGHGGKGSGTVIVQIAGDVYSQDGKQFARKVTDALTREVGAH